METHQAAPPTEDAAQNPPNDEHVLKGVAQLDQDKKLSFIKAWEESRKSRVHNKAERKQAKLTSWENTKKASLEARLRKYEEKMERKKADYAEKLRNKEVQIHQKAEEKRAQVEATKGQKTLEAEELAAKYRAAGRLPKKYFNCFKH